jgi:hypothetical protein
LFGVHQSISNPDELLGGLIVERERILDDMAYWRLEQIFRNRVVFRGCPDDLAEQVFCQRLGPRVVVVDLSDSDAPGVKLPVIGLD